MPRRCVLVGCSNTSREGYVLHQWPKDPKIGRKWKRFVKMTRKWTHPTQWTALCSRHFQDDCYETTELEIFFGYRKKWKSDAVPTIKTHDHGAGAGAILLELEAHSEHVETSDLLSSTAVALPYAGNVENSPEEENFYPQHSSTPK
ncbi:THAP domain-containing protein 2 [Nymphon striatum]|nr:THAP domain-containing protein 2 [Nymphon striatum]